MCQAADVYTPLIGNILSLCMQFQDYLQHGDKSEYSPMFIDWDKFWPEGAHVVRPMKAEVHLLPTPLAQISWLRNWVGSLRAGMQALCTGPPTISLWA